ncbi:MAG: TIR domain-containing protein [Acidobacteriia bacterium]|nr:TIR domain-containing protein [Terriglobia bacterium]
MFAANLTGAQLAEANLQWAILRWTNLTGAQMWKTKLSHSKMNGTLLVSTNLDSVEGLETVKHEGPSPIGIDTIYSSRGAIPDAFLRGAGVPENLVAYVHSLMGTAFEFYSCFISYSSKDQDFANRLHADLQNKAVRCWFAPEDLKTGDKLRSAFDQAIRVHDKLMVVLSESSIKSPWVEKEVETAFEKEREQDRTVLFPIRLDDAVKQTKQAWAADIRRTRHISDFRSWQNHDSYKKAFDRLLRDLKAECKSKPAAHNGT